MQRRALGLFFIALALALFGESIWILAKAQLAQLLLARAWEQRVAGAAEPKPWPWADTWPVALLRAPRLSEDYFVLAGASGRNMAFGPTHVGSSDVLGGASNAVVSGEAPSGRTATRFGHRWSMWRYSTISCRGSRALSRSTSPRRCLTVHP